MVNRDRIIREFMELVRIDSLSLKERRMADVLKEKLISMGYEPFEDDSGKKINGDAGNVICEVKGGKNIPALLLMAHMDTVVPGIGKNPILKDGYIVSDGKTILGGDDAAGIEIILEALRVLKEERIQHGNIQVAFTIAEEIGLLGAKNLDYERINSKYGLVLDCGAPVGTIAVKAPSQNVIDVVIVGKAAHAGIEPEKGINAVKVASHAISEMKLGRIDHETTANIGFIKGGLATNIVCDKVEIAAEARSAVQSKLEAQTRHMRECFENAVAIYGGSVEFKAALEYAAFDINENSELIGILKKAASQSDIELKLTATGGGSDTNVTNQKGIQSVAMGIGMEKVHSVEERILVDDIVKATEFLIEIIKNII